MNRNCREVAGQRTLGNVVSRGGQRSRVEIIDDEDDEVEEINTQGFSETAHGDRASRLRTRRKRRDAAEVAAEAGDDEIDEEWEQLQQALLMSKMEAERQEERRKMCGSLQDVMNLQVEIEPLNSRRLKGLAVETARNSKGEERDEREDTASPVLFSTPPEDPEQLSGIKAAENGKSDTEFPDSPSLPVTVRSPDAAPSGEGQKETVTSAEPPLRQERGDSKRKLKLRRTRQEEKSFSEQKEEIIENEPKPVTLETSEEELQSGNSKGVGEGENVTHGEKRKLGADDIDDITDDEDPIPVLSRRVFLKRKKRSVFEETSDSEDLQDVDKKGSKRATDKENEPLPKRIAVSDCENPAPTPEGKEPVRESKQERTPPSLLHVRLSRRYKKSRLRPNKLKEAMQADLYFAPRGFDLPAYTLLIIRMFEKYRRHLHLAQSKVKTRVPWGTPVPCGNRQGNTLDVRLPGKTTSFGGRNSAFVRGTPRDATSSVLETQLEQDISSRKRTLRSSANQATASTSTRTSTHETLPSYKVDSDSDGEDLMTSYLDKMMPRSVITSRKKAKSSTKNDGTSDGFFAGSFEPRAQSSGEPSAKLETSKHFNLVVTDDEETSKSKTSSRDGPGSSDKLFGADVVLDANVSEVQSNTIDTSDQMAGRDSEAVSSRTSENNLASQTTASKSSGLPEGDVNKADAGFLDTEENESDVIQPPKHRRILRSLDDDSTDDEGDMSQPVFSLRFPTKETSGDHEVSRSRKENAAELRTANPEGRDEAFLYDNIPLDSQSVMTQSESQGILGKSILETIASDGETLLPSQTLSETELSSHKLITETLEDSSTTVSSSSATRSTAKGGAERFTVDVDSDDSQPFKRKRTEAAERAAAAALRRQQEKTVGREPRTAGSSSSHVDPYISQPEEITEDTQQEFTVECPLCYQHFTPKEIEAHASDCQGPPSAPQASYSDSQRESRTTQSRPGPSTSSSALRANPKSAVYQTLSGERGELKNLKVVLQRSPLAKEKLLQKAKRPTDSAKRNLDFEKNIRSSGSLDQYVRPLGSSSRSLDQGSRAHGRNTRASLRTESESERSGYENEKDDDSSQVYSWLDSTSPEKKKNPQQTYGGKSSKQCEDYIPLNTPKQSDDDGIFTRKSSKEKERKQTSRTEEIKSDSDTSGDDSLMVQYGAQRASSRRRTETRQAETAGMDENEIALEQLGGRMKKRPLSVSKASKPRKSRRLRDSDSEDSDELTIVCHLCNEKIPKELYEKHAEEELEERKRMENAPRQVEGVSLKGKKSESSKLAQRRLVKRGVANEDAPSQSSGTEHKDTDLNQDDIDWDSVSDSPIKCFQFTENSTSCVDFKNQFEHLKNTKGGARRGNQERYEGSSTGRGYGQSDTHGGYGGSGARGGYGEFSNRGRYKGAYNNVYGRGRGRGRGRGKKFSGKRRGSRGKR